MPSTSETCRAY